MLQTKLFVPQKRPLLVPRPHLLRKLNDGLHRPLTLISAPAGFGKTTLVTAWIESCQRPVAWFSLDDTDSDPGRFFTYLVAALQTVWPELGSQLLDPSQSAPAALTHPWLTRLLNEMATLPEPFLLVLDDYHALNAPPVHEAIAFLLDHAPPQMHLVLTTREDPPLPLPRLRVRDQLTELRAADLRFTEEETAAFLNQVMGLNLSPADISALETRTEGWIAGLQMAALAMQSSHSALHSAPHARFIEAFTGSHRFILDYLIEEVLKGQAAEVQRFLLKSSLLTRLSGGLCTAVTGQQNSGQLLETLERSNLFVVPLDSERHWYRYHHLFADVLQARLIKEHPDEVAQLHQRASVWYEQHDFTAEAIHHALAAKNHDGAARLIEQSWADMDGSRQSARWLGWATQLPEPLVQKHPVLCAGLAWAYLDNGALETAVQWLQKAEATLAQESSQIVVDENEFRFLPGTLAAARTYHALSLGDMPGTIQHAQQALDFLPAEENLRRGTPAALLGLALWTQGQLAEADHAFTAAMENYRQAGNPLFVITGAYVLAEIKRGQNQLHEAIQLCFKAIQLAETHGQGVMRGAADLYTILSEMAVDQNRLSLAHDYLDESHKLGDTADLPRWRYRWHLAQARLLAAEGQLAEALVAISEAEPHYLRGPVPDLRPADALRARVWVRQGRLGAAQRWASQKGVSWSDEPSYLSEYDLLTVAMIQIAQMRGQDEKTAGDLPGLLHRLLTLAEADGRSGSQLDILIQQAMLYEALGEMPAAHQAALQALTLAQPQDHLRLFTNEGQPMMTIVQQLVADRLANDPAIQQFGQRVVASFAERGAEPPAEAVEQPLVEPLSERELEVLQLVAEGLSNREIAERLYLALPTVKGHNRNIYSKLMVSRRTEAVARARELGLIVD